MPEGGIGVSSRDTRALAGECSLESAMSAFFMPPPDVSLEWCHFDDKEPPLKSACLCSLTLLSLSGCGSHDHSLYKSSRNNDCSSCAQSGLALLSNQTETIKAEDETNLDKAVLCLSMQFESAIFQNLSQPLATSGKPEHPLIACFGFSALAELNYVWHCQFMLRTHRAHLCPSVFKLSIDSHYTASCHLCLINPFEAWPKCKQDHLWDCVQDLPGHCMIKCSFNGKMRCDDFIESKVASVAKLAFVRCTNVSAYCRTSESLIICCWLGKMSLPFLHRWIVHPCTGAKSFESNVLPEQWEVHQQVK